MTLGTKLGGSTLSSAAAAGGSTERTVQVRDGRKYTVGEVATLKHATDTLTGRVISNTPTPKLTAPDAATIVLDTSVNNNYDAAASSAALAVAASAPAPAASPQRSQAALAAERRAAGLPSSPASSADSGTESSGSPTVVSTSSSATSSSNTGSLVTMAPSPAPAPLGPIPLQSAPTLGVSMSGIRGVRAWVGVCELATHPRESVISTLKMVWLLQESPKTHASNSLWPSVRQRCAQRQPYVYTRLLARARAVQSHTVRTGASVNGARGS